MQLRVVWPDEAPPPVQRKGRRLPRFLRTSELDSLFAATVAELERASAGANHHKCIVCSVHVYRAAQQDRIIVILGAFLGLRVSETCGICAEHVNLEDRDVWIRGKGQVERYIPIPDRVFDELAAWVRFRKSGPLLLTRRGFPYYQSLVNLRLEKLGKAIGLPWLLTSHKLRHTFATRLRQTGSDILDIKDLLGHRTLSTVQLYAHCVPGSLRDRVNKL